MRIHRSEHAQVAGSSRRELRPVTALRVPLTGGVRRARARLRDHRHPRPEARARAGRQADEPTGSAAHGCAAAVRQGSAHARRDRSRRLRLWRLVRAAIGHGPEGSDSGLRPRRRSCERDRLRRDVRARGRDPARRASASSGNAKKTTAGVFGWPAGAWIVGIAGAVLIGVALYQGYRGVTKKFLDDSKIGEMGPRVRSGSAARDGWAPRADGRLRARRDLPDQGRDRLQPASARSASTAPSPRSCTARTARSCSASSPPG